MMLLGTLALLALGSFALGALFALTALPHLVELLDDWLTDARPRDLGGSWNRSDLGGSWSGLGRSWSAPHGRPYDWEREGDL
jgi:hypothetical protein